MTSWARRVSAVALPALLFLGLAVPPAAADPSSAYGSWSTAAPVPHVSQGAVSLGDGSVLAFGSSTTGNDRYDPSTNTWHATAAVPDLRAKLGVRLENGSALLVDETGRATVYDPSSDSYSPVTTTGLPYTPEALFALPGGDALVTQKTFYASGDLGAVFHGQTRTWTVLQGPRGGYRFDERNTAVLPSGDVYVTGDGNLERAAWSYDASTDTWTTRSAPPPTGAYAFTTYDGELSFTDHLYDPASDTWRPVPTELYSLYGSAAVNGDDELAAPAGGRAAVYDGATDLWTEIAGPSVSAHWSRSVVVPLADGGALAVGGYSASSNVNLTDAARFSPGHFVAAPTTPAQRADVLAEVTSPSYLPQRTVHVRAVLRDVVTHDRLAGVTADLWQRTAGGWNKVASDTSDSLGVAELVFDSPADGRSLVVRVPAAPGLRPGGSEELDPNLRDQQIPSVPVGVVAVHGLSDHKTRISWVSPDDEGGTPVTSYEYSDQYGGIVRSSVPGSARTLLINGDESHGYLRAVNAVGPGFWVEWNATEGSTATEPPSELCGRSSGATTLGAGTYRVCRSGYHLDPGASLSLDGTGGQVIVGGGTITARAATIRSQGSTRLTSPLALSELGHLLLSGTEVGDVQATGLAEVRLTGDAAGNLITAETPTWVSGGSLGSLHTSCVRRDCEARLTNVDVGSGGVSISGSARVSLKGVAVHGVQGWPVTLTGATFTLGSGGDVDGVTGSGNGIEALNLSSTVTNTITWRDVAAEGQSDVELGYAAANLVAAAGVTVPDSTRLGFVRCSTDCAGLKSDGPVNAGSGTEFGGSTSSFLTPTATVLVRGPGSATLTSSLVHGRFELAGPATGSFTDTELRGGHGLSVHPGDLFVNVPPPPAPKVDLVRTTATQGAGISISRATSTLTGVTVNGGGGVSVSLGSTTVTDLTVHQGSLGMSLLHGSTVKGVQVTDSPGPAVLLSLDGVSFGPGQDVDGLVGSGNGDDSVGISGNIPNASPG